MFPRKRAAWWAAARIAVAGTTFLAAPASAEIPVEAGTGLSGWAIDDADPSKSIPTAEAREKNPLEFGYWLQDITFKATYASRHGDHQAAARYFTAMAQAVPDRAIAFSHLCDEYDALGDRAKALGACGSALYLDGVTTREYAHYAELLLTKPGELSREEETSLATVIKHLRDDAAGHDLADDIECKAGVKASNTLQLEECTANLVAKAPEDPKTILYQWTLAVQRGDYRQAEQVTAHAKAVQMTPEAIEKMQRETDEQVAHHRTGLLWVGLGALLAFSAAVVGGWLYLRKRAQKAPEGEGPSVSAGAQA